MYAILDVDGKIIGFQETDDDGAVSIDIDDYSTALLSSDDAYIIDGVFSLRHVPRSREALELDVISICDLKQRQAWGVILGVRNSVGQVARYKRKYELAKEGHFETEKNNQIIAKYEAMETSVNFYIDLIEEFREFTFDLLDANKLDDAKEAISLGASLDRSVTQSKLREFMDKVKVVDTDDAKKVAKDKGG